MKNVIIVFVLFISNWSYAQTRDVLFHAKVAKEAVPEVVVESVEADFPGETIVEFYGIPVNVVEDVWYVDVDKPLDSKDYDSYTVKISNDKGVFTTVYDKEGNLISEHGKLKNAALPHSIQKSIGQHFPGWTVAGDKVIMTAHQNGHQKVHYKVNLGKDGKTFNAIFDANGNLIKGKQHSAHRKLLGRKKSKK